jgi:hypothetical protein
MGRCRLAVRQAVGREAPDQFRRVRSEQLRQPDASVRQRHGADPGAEFHRQGIQSAAVFRGAQVNQGRDDVAAVWGGAVKFPDGVDDGCAGAELVVHQDHRFGQVQSGTAGRQQLV